MVRPKPDCIGQTFGFLTVIDKETPLKGETLWILQCKCGKQIKKRRGDFDSNPPRQKSCGCLRKSPDGWKRKPRDITGQRFGSLTIVKLSNKRIYNRPAWLAKCDCGNYREIGSRQLSAGWKLNCGAKIHSPGSWYPPTPSPLPQLVWETVIKYLPLTEHKGKFNNLAVRDYKIERLIRHCWILHYREIQRENMTQQYKDNYIKRCLSFASIDVFWQQKLEQHGGLLYTVDGIKKQIK
jgi:hypothetical protein